jgi:hypothetical protein
MAKKYSNFDSSHTLGLEVMKSEITLGLYKNCKSMSNFFQKINFHFVNDKIIWYSITLAP